MFIRHLIHRLSPSLPHRSCTFGNKSFTRSNPFQMLPVRLYSNAPNATKVTLSIQSPTMTFLKNEQVDLVGVPGSVGEFVIAPNASPVFTELKSGVIHVRSNDIDTKYFVSGGFAIASGDSTLNISVGECILLEHVDLEAARQIVTNSQNAIGTGTDEERALAQISLDTATAMIKAVEMK